MRIAVGGTPRRERCLPRLALDLTSAHEFGASLRDLSYIGHGRFKSKTC